VREISCSDSFRDDEGKRGLKFFLNFFLLETRSDEEAVRGEKRWGIFVWN